HRDTCKIISIQFGHRHVLALSDRGKVFSWGDNGQGQLGLSDIQTRYEPNFVEELRNEAVKQIVAVGNMSYALTSKDRARSTLGARTTRVCSPSSTR
ncbi:unnamed protein product, partial [Prorocentrum cordatum]